MPKRKTNAPQGRPFGSRNAVNREWKRAVTQEAIAAAGNGIMPLEYMLGVMRDDKAPTIRRDDMAKAAAPYLHPKLTSVQVSGDADNPLQVVARIERIIVDDANIENTDGESVPPAA